MQEGTEPGRDVARLADGADHPFGVAELPQLERRHDQLVPVGEVPVEAALGGTQLLGQRLDRDGREASASQRHEGGFAPVRGGQRFALSLGHVHTLPYGQSSIRRRMERFDMTTLIHHPVHTINSGAGRRLPGSSTVRVRRGSVVAVPRPSTPLLACTLLRVDWSDAFAVTVPFGARGRPPEVWADAIFRDRPPSVRALFAARDVLVRLCDIEPGTPRAFDVVAWSARRGPAGHRPASAGLPGVRARPGGPRGREHRRRGAQPTRPGVLRAGAQDPPLGRPHHARSGGGHSGGAGMTRHAHATAWSCGDGRARDCGAACRRRRHRDRPG